MQRRTMIWATAGVLMIAGCGPTDQPTVRRGQIAPNGSAGPSRSAGMQSKSETRDAEVAARQPHHPTAPTLNVVPATPSAGSLATRRSMRAERLLSSESSTKHNDTEGWTAEPADSGSHAGQRAASQDVGDSDSREIRFGGISLVAPDSWTRERPPMRFILAEFNIPGGSGESSDAQVTVTMAINNDRKSVIRLRRQLDDEERSKESDVKHMNIRGHEVIVVDSSEENDPQSGGDGRSRALNAMVFLADSVFFVNCTGPEETIANRSGEFRDFLQSMKEVN